MTCRLSLEQTTQSKFSPSLVQGDELYVRLVSTPDDVKLVNQHGPVLEEHFMTFKELQLKGASGDRLHLLKPKGFLSNALMILRGRTSNHPSNASTGYVTQCVVSQLRGIKFKDGQACVILDTSTRKRKSHADIWVSDSSFEEHIVMHIREKIFKKFSKPITIQSFLDKHGVSPA